MGELQPPVRCFAFGRGRCERFVERSDSREKTGRNLWPWFVALALMKQVNWLGLSTQICPTIDVKTKLLIGRASLV